MGTSARHYILKKQSYSSFETIGYTERKGTSLDKRFRERGTGGVMACQCHWLSENINSCGIAYFGLCRKSRDLVSGDKVPRISMSRFRRSMMACSPCDAVRMTDRINIQ